MSIDLVIPIRVAGPNLREHHFARKRRVEMERNGVNIELLIRHGPYWLKKLSGPPYVVSMVRVGPRELDTDNLQGALKAIRDQVARELGLNDSPTSPIEWRYAQRKGDFAVEVRIESVAAIAAVAAGER